MIASVANTVATHPEIGRGSENQLISITWTPSFYGYDGHGNTRFLTNAAGTVTDGYQYDSFGMPVANSGATANNFRYGGEWLDGNIGLYHLRARYYNQATGRFETMDHPKHCRCDESRPISSHKYIYADDDPVNRIDPTGRAATADAAEVESLPVQVFQLATKVTPRVPVPSSAGGVTGTILLTAAIRCGFSVAASLVGGTAQNLGYVQQIQFYPCLAKVRHIPPTGPLEAPFNPLDEITGPGSPWICNDPGPNGTQDCTAPCPPGSPRQFKKLTFDPGSYGKPAHWDYTDCEGNSWYIWLDGSMSPAG